jgi:predicted transposase/invertase (TIGR01784 family)
MINNTKRSTPHDYGFKGAMQDIRVAKQFLQTFIPTRITRLISWDSVKIEKESFVDKHLQMKASDILYSTKFKERLGYIYLLIEHQSTPDKKMPFRLLRYMVNIMDLHLKQTAKACLPIIYPMVFYTGAKPYYYSMDLFDLFDEDKAELAKTILLGPYQLINSNEISDEEVSGLIWAGTFIKVMKYVRNGKILEFLKKMKENFQEIADQKGIDFLANLFQYIYECADIKFDEFKEVVKETFTTEAEDTMTTLAQRLRDEGYRKGVTKGMVEGRTEEKVKLANKLMKTSLLTKEQIRQLLELSESDLSKIE